MKFPRGAGVNARTSFDFLVGTRVGIYGELQECFEYFWDLGPGR